MSRGRLLACSLVVLTLVFFAVGMPDNVRAAEQGWGSVTGQYVLDGEIPKPKLQRKKGDTKLTDAAVCCGKDHYSNDLLVDEKTKGIANVFVFIYKRKNSEPIHPDLAESKVKELVFDQKDCTFKPHVLLVRTDQSVRVLSDDPISHNTHTFPLRNKGINLTSKPNDRQGALFRFMKAETLPIQVKCDIHPWMLAYWLILDHPYMALTDKEGKFGIDKLPAGEQEFRVWHEKVGWIDRKLKFTITSGGTTKLAPVKVPVEKFKD